MTLRERIAKWIAPAQDREAMQPGGSDPVPDWMRPGVANTQAGTTITPSLAMTSIPIFAAVSAIAEPLGQLPIHVYRKESPYGKTRLGAGDHPAAALLAGIMPTDATPQGVVEAVTAQALIWGTGYAWIVRDRQGNPIDLIPLDSDKTKPRDKRPRRIRGRRLFVTEIQGREYTIADFDLIRICGPSLNGYMGIGRVNKTKDDLAVGKAATEAAADAFANAAAPSGAVSHPGSLTKDAALKLRRYVEEQHAGLGNRHRPIVLAEGAKFEPYKINLEQAQLLASRQFAVEDAGRLFRVPSLLLNHTKDSNFSIGETLMRHYVTLTLGPWGRRWRIELTRKLIAPDQAGTMFIAHDFRALLQGDHATRGAFYKELHNMGAITPAEIRELEDMNPYATDVGAEPLVNAAVVTLASVEAGQSKTAQAQASRSDTPAGEIPDGAMITARDAAAAAGINYNATRKRLDRWRSKTPAGDWMEIEQKDATDPRYLYRWGAIRAILTTIEHNE